MAHLIRKIEFPASTYPPVALDGMNRELQRPCTNLISSNVASTFYSDNEAIQEIPSVGTSANPAVVAISSSYNLESAELCTDQEESMRDTHDDEYTTVDAVAGQIPHQDEDIVCSQPIVPFVGMMFDTLEDAKKVYNQYAYKLGFGIRIASSRTSKVTKKLIRREFECSHARKPDEEGENSASNSICSSKNNVTVNTIGTRKRNRMTKFDCKAHMAVGLRDDRWQVIVMQEEHTHPLVNHVARRRFYRSHRHISSEDFDFLQTLHHRNISTSHIMALLGDMHGGVRNLTFTKKDVCNIRTKLRQNITYKDMAVTIEYFQRLQSESPSFFYAIKLDENQSVRALFWVDGRTRVLYQHFRDCVFFDTTFMTNRYNMPFAPFVGINNHMQTILLGCGLLPDETIETFVWLFETWKLAMNGHPPICIMTDQDKAMKSAISQVFSSAIHRCCKWHVMHKAQEKLARLIATKDGFSDDLHRIVDMSQNVDEFESSWQDMLRKYALHDNQHLLNMWNSRCTWAPAYFRKNFFPFTSTTGRSEGLNAIFKTLVHPQDSVWTFVKQYEYIIDTMLNREDDHGFRVETTNPPLWSRYNLEKQASKFYTRSVFFKFQEQLMQTTSYACTVCEQPTTTQQVFALVIPGINPNKTFTVTVNADTSTYVCSCNMFAMDGLLCAHVLKVMTQLNLQQIPQHYLLRRWSDQATRKISQQHSGSGPSFGVPPTNVLRFNSLCRKMTDLASDACLSEETYKIVSEAIDNIAMLISATSNTTTPNPDDVETSASCLVRNPPKSARKGRPSEKSQRKKTPVEKAIEKKKRSKGKIHCSYCKDDTHNVQRCPYLELAKTRDAYLTDKAHRETELTL